MSSAEGGSEVVRLPQRAPFTMVDNPIIRAMNDYVALGLYVDMLSYPPGWRLNLRELARTRKQGRVVLTTAMNELISRGLVFRVRYQQSSGLWATRTYVCSAPVTLPELQEIRSQYRACSIETTDELTEALKQSGPSGRRTSTPSPSSPEADETAPRAPDHRGNTGRSPSTRFPTLGEPAPGQPAAGEPGIGQPDVGRRDPQGLDSRSKIHPPPPSPTPSAGSQPVDPQPEARPEEEEALQRIEQALARAWPTLGRRDLAGLRPSIAAALGEHSERTLVEYLAGNTEGAKHPGKVLAARLQNLPPPPAAGASRRASAPWCGLCESGDYRWIQHAESGTFGPCPRCSPQAVAS